MKFSILLFAATAFAADTWPAFWCDKECNEAVLFAKGCQEIEGIRNCLCSSHFHRKLRKCQSDGCDENYANKNWAARVEPLLKDCEGEYYDGPI